MFQVRIGPDRRSFPQRLHNSQDFRSVLNIKFQVSFENKSNIVKTVFVRMRVFSIPINHQKFGVKIIFVFVSVSNELKMKIYVVHNDI